MILTNIIQFSKFYCLHLYCDTANALFSNSFVTYTMFKKPISEASVSADGLKHHLPLLSCQVSRDSGFSVSIWLSGSQLPNVLQEAIKEPPFHSHEIVWRHEVNKKELIYSDRKALLIKSYRGMNAKQRMLADISDYFIDASASQSNVTSLTGSV